MDLVFEVCMKAQSEGTLRDSRAMVNEEQPCMVYLKDESNYLYSLDIFSEDFQKQEITGMQSMPKNFAYAIGPDKAIYLAGGS